MLRCEIASAMVCVLCRNVCVVVPSAVAIAYTLFNDCVVHDYSHKIIVCIVVL